MKFRHDDLMNELYDSMLSKTLKELVTITRLPTVMIQKTSLIINLEAFIEL